MARFFTRSLPLLLVLCPWIADSPQAQPSTIRSEFQVNQETSGYQTAANITFSTTGGFLVVWEDESSNRLAARRFSSAGQPLADERTVIEGLGSPPLAPVTAPLTTDPFLVVWQSPPGELPGDGDASGIAARRLADDGSPAGDVFQVNSVITGSQTSPDLATDAASGVAVWTSDSSPGNDASGTSILGRALSTDGTPLASDFQINVATAGDQSAAVVAPSGDGFVVLWRDTNSDRLVSRHLESGLPVGAEAEVTSGSMISAPALAPLGDGLVAVWRDGTADTLEARFLDTDGTPRGTAFRVDPPDLQSPREPAVMAAENGFVVVWTSYGGPQDADDAILGQLMDSGGRPVGEAFEVNSFTTETQYRPHIDSREGHFVVVWTTQGGTGNDTDYAIAGRVYEQPYFADGFESGDFEAWSSATP